MNNKTYKDEVEEAFRSRMHDIRTLYEAEDQKTENLGSLNDYGLHIDKVEAGTRVRKIMKEDKDFVFQKLQRSQHICIKCHGSKDIGLIVCWKCWKDDKKPFKYFTGTLLEYIEPDNLHRNY